MIQTLISCFTIPDLRNKILFTLAMLLIYRIGYAVPLPGVNQGAMAAQAADEDSPWSSLATTFAMFTGGSIEQSTIFGLGIMPYISAAIIFQLLATVVPALEKLQKEGPVGYRKIQEYTRYATVVLALFQAVVMLRLFQGSSSGGSFLYAEIWDSSWLFSLWWVTAVLCLTGGTVFLMWLGEQIDEYGIGNGTSLIISAGIIAHLPGAIAQVYQQSAVEGSMNAGSIVVLMAMFVAVTAGAIFITQAQRRIPIKQAKQVRGMRMMAGSTNYLPLRVNHGGVMPIIFASAIIMFPTVLFNWLSDLTGWGFMQTLASSIASPSGFLHMVLYVIMIYFFAFFWTTVQFRPKDIANQLRDNGSFVEGLRPGKRTADYLETVMERITYVGAGFLSVIALLPFIISDIMGIPPGISTFLGGTGLLIVVSVTLDFVQRVEAQLAMRNYGTFLDPTGGGAGQRMRGAYGQ